jgi:CHASE3 domain sensor protein
MPISVRFVIRLTIGLLALGFLALFGIVGMTSWLNERASLNFDNAIAVRDIRGAAVELRDALRTAESSQRGYVFTGNEIYLAPYDAAKVQARRQLEALKRLLPADPTIARVFRSSTTSECDSSRKLPDLAPDSTSPSRYCD